MSRDTPLWCGILLAAGRGRRFDASGAQNKLMQVLPSGVTVAVSSASNLLAVLPLTLAVVPTPAHDPASTDTAPTLPVSALASELEQAGCSMTFCPPPSENLPDGMARSLIHGLQQAGFDCDGWVIALADMPFVKPESIAALVAALRDGAGIAVLVHQGRRGNPVGFSRQYLPQLLELSGDLGARSLLNIYPVTEVDVDDPGIFQDIDVPQDLLIHPDLSN